MNKRSRLGTDDTLLETVRQRAFRRQRIELQQHLKEQAQRYDDWPIYSQQVNAFRAADSYNQGRSKQLPLSLSPSLSLFLSFSVSSLSTNNCFLIIYHNANVYLSYRTIFLYI